LTHLLPSACVEAGVFELLLNFLYCNSKEKEGFSIPGKDGFRLFRVAGLLGIETLHRKCSVRSWCCDECGRKFVQRENLQAHQRGCCSKTSTKSTVIKTTSSSSTKSTVFKTATKSAATSTGRVAARQRESHQKAGVGVGRPGSSGFGGSSSQTGGTSNGQDARSVSSKAKQPLHSGKYKPTSGIIASKPGGNSVAGTTSAPPTKDINAPRKGKVEEASSSSGSSTGSGSSKPPPPKSGDQTKKKAEKSGMLHLVSVKRRFKSKKREADMKSAMN
jgi:hypothetical protein